MEFTPGYIFQIGLLVAGSMTVEKTLLMSVQFSFLCALALACFIVLNLMAIVHTSGLTRKFLWVRVQEFGLALAFCVGWVFIAKDILTS